MSFKVILTLVAVIWPSLVTAGVLKIATVNNSDLQIAQELSKEFLEQHPSISIDWLIVDESTLRLIQSRDSKKEAHEYDIYTLGFLEASTWGGLGRLQQVPNWITQSKEYDDFLPSILDGFRSPDGDLFALPFYGESSMTYYRKDRFAQYGIEFAQHPKWSEITDVLAQLREASSNRYGNICLRGKAGWGENVALFSTILNSFGGRWFDLDWQSTIGEEQWQSALMFYLDTQKEFGLPASWNNGYSENLTAFSEGECDVWVDSTAAASSLNSTLGSEKVGYALAPYAFTKKGSSWLWSWGFSVPKNANNSDDAWLFVNWMTSKEYQNLVGREKGIDRVPPGTRKWLYESPEYRAFAPFWEKSLDSIMKSKISNQTMLPTPYNGIQYVQTPEFEQLGQFIGGRLSDILSQYVTGNEDLNISKDLKLMSDFANSNRRVAQYLLDRGIDKF